MNNIKLIIHNTNLNIKALFKNGSNIILLFLIATFPIILPIFFVPLGNSIGLVILAISFFVPMSIYAFIASNFRNSTLYSNSNLTKSNRWTFQFSILITITLFTYFFVIYVLIFLGILNHFDLLITRWLDIESGNYYKITGMNSGYVIYQVFTCIIVAFSLSYFIDKQSGSQKTHFITMMILLIITIIFGGAFNQYFGNARTVPDHYIVYYCFPSSSLFPSSIYAPSLFIPFFSQGQMLSIMGQRISFNADGTYINGSFGYWYYTPWIWQTKSLANIDLSRNFATWQWNILWLIPYIQTAIWIFAGTIISKTKNK